MIFLMIILIINMVSHWRKRRHKLIIIMNIMNTIKIIRILIMDHDVTPVEEDALIVMRFCHCVHDLGHSHHHHGS